MFDIEQLIRPNIRQLTPYASARDEFQGEADIYLDANENPYDWSFSRYPDPNQSALKNRIAEIKGQSVNNLTLGNGSDELLDLLMRIFCRPGVDKIRALNPSYGMYNVAAAINDLEVLRTNLDDDFNIEVTKDNWHLNEKIFFLCSPNNPTGNTFSITQIQKICSNYPGIVVVDEAYIDFSNQQSCLNLVSDNQNLVILQTFSKSWAAAGLRIGMAWASLRITKLLQTVKPPYNISAAAQVQAYDLLKNFHKLDSQIQSIKENREELAIILSSFSFVVKVFPSQANFILIRVLDSTLLYRFLMNKGIITRNRNGQFNCDNCLRISIGTTEENNTLVYALKQFENA